MTETIGQIDTVLDVNMEIEPQCEHSQHETHFWTHDGSAKYLVAKRSHGCLPAKSFLICDLAWQCTGIAGILCSNCGNRFHRDDLWTIIEVL